MTQETWLEIAKVFGLPVAGFSYWAYCGYHQKWVWGHEKSDALKANGELKTERDMYRDLYFKAVDDNKRELGELKRQLELLRAGGLR